MVASSRSDDARFVVALVATRGRFDLLAQRAIPSILAQSRRPDRLLIVVDQAKKDLPDPDLAKLARTLQSQCGPGLPVTVLRNRRTPVRAAGAWNTGLDQLHRDERVAPQADLWFVAILDDDDRWESDHLQLCMDAAVRGDLSMVAAGLIRHEVPDDAGHKHTIPSALDRREQFVRGQHIQGSNLFVRLDMLLMVGGFDEHLSSCTDRDICLRLARLDGLRFGRVDRHTVHHVADLRTDRLSTPGSQAKLQGLTAFWQKHADTFDAATQVEAAERGLKLFGWRFSEPESKPGVMPALSGSPRPVDMVLGFVTDAQVPAHVAGLLEDCLQLMDHPGVAWLKVVVAENGPLPAEDERTLQALVLHFQQRGLNIELISIERQREDWEQGRLIDVPNPVSQRLPIAVSRTVLNTYVAAAAEQRPGAWAWILDDDKRLSLLVDLGDGRTMDRASPDLATLCALQDSGVDVVIGPDTGAAPLPFVATLRMQLVDLAHCMAVARALPAGAPWPDRRVRSAAHRQAMKDTYYDLSRFTEHLETPFLVTPPSPGCTAGEVIAWVASRVSRLLAGESVFRPLLVTVDAFHPGAATDSVQRGGSTIFFSPRHLRDYPQTLARFGDRYVRRSDMLVSQLMRDQLGLRIVMHAAAGVRHDRSATKAARLDGRTLHEDVLGYALYRAEHELMQARSLPRRRDPLLAWTGAELKDAVRLVNKNVEERLAAFTLSCWRIRGLAAAVRKAAEEWKAAAVQSGSHDVASNLDLVIAEMHLINGQFRQTSVAECAKQIRKGVCDRSIRDTFASMDGVISEYRATNPDTGGSPIVGAAREARARALLTKAYSTGDLRLLGMGGEGVVFTDGQQVYKVFDLLKRRPNHNTQETLLALRARADRPKHLYELTRVETRNETLLVTYPFEESEPYAGGMGPQLIGLLRECKELGIVFRNMHPKNLRLVGGTIKLIDYGSDIRPWSEGGWRSMAERAWLTWRWSHRPDLDELMRKALADKELPELDGFGLFWEALCDAKPSATRMVAALVDPIVLESGASSVLDYGCGKKARSARNLAAAGLRVVGFDPEQSASSRWVELGQLPANLALTTSRQSALASAPFDAVICSLVLHLLPNGPEYEVALADLRNAVRDDGLVVVTIGNPFATFGRPTPLHRRRDLPPGVTYEDQFLYLENAETGVGRTEFHRPLRKIERDLLRHGLQVIRREETRAVDLERFEPASDFMTLVCRAVPVVQPGRRCSLVIKTCAMEAGVIERLAKHLAQQLEGPRVFAERILAIDSRRGDFTRQHAAGDLEALEQAADRLLRHGVIDRVVKGPSPGPESGALMSRWFGVESEATHTGKGAPLAMPLAAFEACTGDYILQVDSDLLVARMDRQFDFLGELIAALDADPRAVSIALNVTRGDSIPVTAESNGSPWRVEVRGCLLHRARLLASRPLCNEVVDGAPVLSWHRSLDGAVREGRVASLRGGSSTAAFVHPQNESKRSVADWMLLVDCIEKRCPPATQVGQVDLVGGPLQWVPRNRSELLVFVITGRNVPPGCVMRCLASLRAQQRTDFGIVLVDDASDAWSQDFLSRLPAAWNARMTLIQPRERRGQLANLVLAIRHVCTNPDAIIVTLDLDDALLGRGVVDRIVDVHMQGADVTVGSMLRTDKHVQYPVQFEEPRSVRGGNCWQHLRTFRKRLFDAIPDHELRLAGNYVDIAVDWAFMMPIVEAASRPVWIREPLYLYEPSGLGKGADRAAREAQIGSIVSRASRSWVKGKSASTLLRPEDLAPDVFGASGGILFLRHGERPSFAGLSHAEKDATRLTLEGREAALAVGRALGRELTIVSSPVRRVVDTAEAVADGSGCPPEAIQSVPELVHFRLAPVEVYEAVKHRLSWTGLMGAWTDGSLPTGLLMPCEVVAKSVIESVQRQSISSRIVALTHDFIVIALLASLRGERVTAVPYLGGVFVPRDEAARFLGGVGR